MELGRLADLGEFVGGVAVLVTLLYLVIQVRQNTAQLHQATEVARGSAEIETAKMNMTYFIEFARDPRAIEAWERAFSEPDSLTPDERARFNSTTAVWFHLAQGHYRQYRRGLLPEESWEPIARGLAGAMRQPAIRRFWEHNLYNLAIDFRSHVEELAATYADEAWVPVSPSEIGAS